VEYAAVGLGLGNTFLQPLPYTGRIGNVFSEKSLGNAFSHNV